MHLASQLTVFRNIEYFRKFFATTYNSKTTGQIVEIGLLFQQPGQRYGCRTYNLYICNNSIVIQIICSCIVCADRMMGENYGIWFALRHPSITFKCDFTRQIWLSLFVVCCSYLFYDEIVSDICHKEYCYGLIAFVGRRACRSIQNS